MLGALFARLRQFSRQRRQQRLIAQLSEADQAALASQATPDLSRVLVVRHDSIGDFYIGLGCGCWRRKCAAAAST
jgi:hypothetical protein